MHGFSQGFKLCTCNESKIIHNKNARRPKRKRRSKRRMEYVWQLYNHVGLYELYMEGTYDVPYIELSEDLTGEKVLKTLNTSNCFDFEYIPKEGDCLIIRIRDKWYYRMDFVFKDGNWVEEQYSPVDNKPEGLLNGIIASDSDINTDDITNMFG